MKTKQNEMNKRAVDSQALRGGWWLPWGRGWDGWVNSIQRNKGCLMMEVEKETRGIIK